MNVQSTMDVCKLRKEPFICEHSLVIVRNDEIGMLINNSIGVNYWLCNNDKAVLCWHKNGNDDKSLLLNIKDTDTSA